MYAHAYMPMPNNHLLQNPLTMPYPTPITSLLPDHQAIKDKLQRQRSIKDLQSRFNKPSLPQNQHPESARPKEYSYDRLRFCKENIEQVGKSRNKEVSNRIQEYMQKYEEYDKNCRARNNDLFTQEYESCEIVSQLALQQEKMEIETLKEKVHQLQQELSVRQEKYVRAVERKKDRKSSIIDSLKQSPMTKNYRDDNLADLTNRLSQYRPSPKKQYYPDSTFSKERRVSSRQSRVYRAEVTERENTERSGIKQGKQRYAREGQKLVRQSERRRGGEDDEAKRMELISRLSAVQQKINNMVKRA